VAVTATDPSGNSRTNSYQVNVPSGADTSFIYDLNGNLTSDGSKTYEWDAANRCVAINVGTHRTEMSYDGLGRRVHLTEKDSGNITSEKRFLWCGNELCEERDASGGTVTKRFFGQGEQRVGGSDAGLYFYTRDHLGTVREMSDATGAIRARYEYDLWGQRAKLAGDMDCDFGFTGFYFHNQTGLNFSRTRAYDSVIGKWISRDPLGEAGGIDLYEYVGNDAINGIDPWGLLTLLIHGTYSTPQTFDAAFRAAVGSTFGETPVTWQWSGEDNDQARRAAGYKLARYLRNYEHEHPCEPINVVAHSHGGNVAFIASQFVNIDNLVALGTPILGRYEPNVDNIGSLINIYSASDSVQPKGGTAHSLFGQEFGHANQTLPEQGAVINIQLTGFSHSGLHTVGAWNQVFH
jgi:RHS repeat-associated protein